MPATRLYAAYHRFFQVYFRLLAHALPGPEPEFIRGVDGLSRLAQRLKARGVSRALLVTDAGTLAAGLERRLLSALSIQSIGVETYADTAGDPTAANVEGALARYRDAACQALVGLGGDAPIDCAKGVAVRLAQPKRSLRQARGPFWPLRPATLLAVIPTTVGAGSEVAMTASVTDDEGCSKIVVSGLSLMPRIVVLDSAMIQKGRPRHLTAVAGMNALARAVEAYLAYGARAQTRRDAREAVRLVAANLRLAYVGGENPEIRAAMQKASFLAGKSFARVHGGYAHAIALTLSGHCGVSSSLANALALPCLLEGYGGAVRRRLAELAGAIGAGRSRMSDAQRAQAFVSAVRDLSRALGIPETVPGLRAKDIPTLAALTLREANPLYPVPKVLGLQDMSAIYARMIDDR